MSSIADPFPFPSPRGLSTPCQEFRAFDTRMAHLQSRFPLDFGSADSIMAVAISRVITLARRCACCHAHEKAYSRIWQNFCFSRDSAVGTIPVIVVEALFWILIDAIGRIARSRRTRIAKDTTDGIKCTILGRIFTSERGSFHERWNFTLIFFFILA